MPDPGSTAYAWLTLCAAVSAVLVLGLLARWTFGGSRIGRLREPRSTHVEASDYGLLVDVATAPTREDAELLRGILAEHGIRCTLAPQLGRRHAGARSPYVVLVFPGDEVRARTLVGIR